MSAEHVYIRVRSADCRLLSGACAGHADRKFRIEVRNRIFVRCPPEGLRSDSHGRLSLFVLRRG